MCLSLWLDKFSKLKILFIFALINLIFGIVAIFLRSAKTDRFEEALIYLEQRNNGTFNFSVFSGCKKNEIFPELYCDVDGKNLRIPSENIEYESLFKNWKNVELSLSISRAIISYIYLLFEYFVIHRKINDLNLRNQEMNNRFRGLLNYLLFFDVILFFYNLICLILRFFLISPDNDIGVYEGNTNSFYNKLMIQLSFDFFEAFFCVLEFICLRKTGRLIILEGAFLSTIPRSTDQIKEREVIIRANKKSDIIIVPFDNFNSLMKK